MTILVLCFV